MGVLRSPNGPVAERRVQKCLTSRSLARPVDPVDPVNCCPGPAAELQSILEGPRRGRPPLRHIWPADVQRHDLVCV